MCSYGHGEALASLFVKCLHENSPANQSISFLLRTRSWAYENCILTTHIPPVALTLNWFLVVLPMPSLPQGVKEVVRGLALATAVIHWDSAPALSRASSYKPFNPCEGRGTAILPFLPMTKVRRGQVQKLVKGTE